MMNRTYSNNYYVYLYVGICLVFVMALTLNIAVHVCVFGMGIHRYRIPWTGKKVRKWMDCK